jgi:(1->4)-alpha-D-glucan 1-alpha-D-glucosylmutase
MRFQQLTGPAMAKGVEDTAFYCFNRLISLNEVGDSPGRFGVSAEEFHDYCAFLQARWPETLLTTATHDTKRGEDTRLRIHLLSEIPKRWATAVHGWFRFNARFRKQGFPDANTEYVLYQTLVGAWPIGTGRLVPYMLKAAREAKAHTSWTSACEGYEQILRDFTEAILAHRPFVDSLERFLRPLVAAARIASLSQTLIRCTAPGIPDLYQGAELWDLSLVDPDNRRAVNFDARKRLLAQIEGLSCGEILRRMEEGLPKLFTLQRALAVRRRLKDAFGPQSTYEPLAAQGVKADHAVAYIRGGSALTLAPRLIIGLGRGWGDTVLELPPGRWRNAFTDECWKGEGRRVSELLRKFPVGLFIRDG